MWRRSPGSPRTRLSGSRRSGSGRPPRAPPTPRKPASPPPHRDSYRRWSAFRFSLLRPWELRGRGPVARALPCCSGVAARSEAITSIGARILSLRVSSSTRQRFAIDTHIVDAPDGASARLRQLHGEGTIELLRTDVVDTELSGRQDPDHRPDLLRAASQYEERPGVAVWGTLPVGPLQVRVG